MHLIRSLARGRQLDRLLAPTRRGPHSGMRTRIVDSPQRGLLSWRTLLLWWVLLLWRTRRRVGSCCSARSSCTSSSSGRASRVASRSPSRPSPAIPPTPCTRGRGFIASHYVSLSTSRSSRVPSPSSDARSAEYACHREAIDASGTARLRCISRASRVYLASWSPTRRIISFGIG